MRPIPRKKTDVGHRKDQEGYRKRRPTDPTAVGGCGYRIAVDDTERGSSDVGAQLHERDRGKPMLRQEGHARAERSEEDADCWSSRVGARLDQRDPERPTMYQEMDAGVRCSVCRASRAQVGRRSPAGQMEPKKTDPAAGGRRGSVVDAGR